VAFWFIAAVTALRLILAATQGMYQDECYYWTWSRHLDLSYVDQGPGIAYFVRLGTFFFGDTPLGVRLSSVLLSAGTSWLVYLTARRWFDSKVGLWTVILLSAAPLLFAGGFMATYDIPQVFFWAVAVYALTKTLLDDNPKLWYAVGVLTLIYVFSFIDRQILNLLVKPIRRDLGISDTQMSLNASNTI